MDLQVIKFDKRSKRKVVKSKVCEDNTRQDVRQGRKKRKMVLDTTAASWLGKALLESRSAFGLGRKSPADASGNGNGRCTEAS